MKPTVRTTLSIAAIAVLVGVLLYQVRTMQAGTQSGVLEMVAHLTLHGTTPTMSWSPNGARLVVNSGYHYYGEEGLLQAHADEQGIHVIDAQNGSHRHLHDQQGYHPFWLDDDTVGWAHSKYEEGSPGLYTADVGAKAKATRHGTFEGVHNAYRGKEGGIVMYLGWPDSEGWVVYDPETDKRKPLDRSSSWTPPEDAEDQCLQKVGQVSVTTSASGLQIDVGGEKIEHKAPVFSYTYSGCTGEHCGPVSACLSPNGRYVAYFKAGKEQASYTVEVLALP